VPIYEYLCEGCACTFEVKQSMKDDPITTCERCGKPVRRLISSPAIMFKGSGWYVTDYSDKLKPPSSGEPAAPAAEEKKEASGAPPASSTAPAASSTTPSAPSSPAGTTAPPPSTPATTPSSK
jgi:putative FmdB family regulatory protein